MSRKKRVDTVQRVLDLSGEAAQTAMDLAAAEGHRAVPATETLRDRALKGLVIVRRVLGKTVH